MKQKISPVPIILLHKTVFMIPSTILAFYFVNNAMIKYYTDSYISTDLRYLILDEANV